MNKRKKQTTIIVSSVVAVLLLICGMYTYHVKQQQDIEQNARQEIALWIVRHFKYKEPIKEMDFTSFSKPTIFGGGGYSADVVVNGSKKDHLFVSVRDIKHPIVDDEVLFMFYDDAVWKDAKDKHRTLDHIKVGYWRGSY